MAQSERLDLLSNASATGSAKQSTVSGRFIFSIVGTFNGATAQLQMLGPDEATYIDLANGSFTAAGAASIDVPRGGQFRVSISGGPPSGMYANLVRVDMG